MIVRVRSKDGTFRIELPPTAEAGELATKILEITKNADPNSLCLSSQPKGGETPITKLLGRTLQDLGLKHGDMVFLSYTSYDDLQAKQGASDTPSVVNGASSKTIDPKAKVLDAIQEEEVDRYWRSKDGKIPRSRDSRFCKHGANAMCDYCMPLEPYDSTYHQKHSIKHLSFHAYLRKVSPPGGPAVPPLTPESYRVKVPCPKAGHLPWPAGICTACQPPAITLQPQTFRMVDHVEFTSHGMVDRFIDAWRTTGVQRFGFLIGRTEKYEEVPMGIKVVVEAIHEPLQQGDEDGLTVALPWADEERIAKLAAECSPPLQIVGQIFTDLTAQEGDRSKLLYKRHPKSFTMSGLEAILAAKLQLKHPTKTRASSTGIFGSRFVTVIAGGTKDGGADLQAFQVSEAACAMVDADMIEPSVKPGVVRVKSENATGDDEPARYIPEVFYRDKNQYGIEVKQSAKPSFPVEYLMVNLTHGFPTNESPLFRSTQPFPIENRMWDGQTQNTDKLIAQLGKLDAPLVLDSKLGSEYETRRRRELLAKWLSDWHLLAFWNQVGFLSERDIAELAKIATNANLEDPAILDNLLKSDGWQTLMTIVNESKPAPRPNVVPNVNGGDEPIPPELLDDMDIDDSFGDVSIKTCPHCTFENPGSARDCEVCGLPLN